MAALRLTGSKALWVEGWTDPPEAAITDDDCNAYGRIGFENGAVCTIPSGADAPARTSCIGVSGTQGQAWIARPCPVLLDRINDGGDFYPVFPPFLRKREERGPDTMTRAVNTFVNLYGQYAETEQSTGENGRLAYCSGHDYRQALEIAIALKISARSNHQRVELPLKERRQILNPVPYRLLGGDVTGWDAIGLKPPKIRT